MSSRKKIAFNTLIQIIGKIITASSTFFVTIILARTFGVDGYGEYTKIAAYIAFFLLLIDFGMNAVALPLMENLDERSVFSHLFLLRLLFGMVLVAIACGMTVVLPFDATTAQGFSTAAKIGIILMATTIIPQGIILSGNAIFQRHLRYDRSVIANSVGSLIGLLGLIAVAAAGGNLLWAIGVLSLGTISSAVFTLVLLRSFIPQLSLAFSRSLFNKLIRASIPLGLTLAFNLLYLRANTLILATTRSTIEVGIFGLAYKFFEFTLTLPTFFMNAVYPILLARQNQAAELKKTISKAFIFLIASSIGVFFLGFVAAPMVVIIKQDFLPSVLPFRILIAALPFFYLTSLTMWLLILFESRRALVMIYGGSMIISIIMNFLFVPNFGYVAAALITSFGEAIILLLSSYVVVKEIAKFKNPKA